MTIHGAAIFFVLITLFINILSQVVAAARLSRQPVENKAGEPQAISIIRPVCGIENFCTETLSSTYGLDYPRYEVIFCVARPDDAALPLLRRLVDANPQVPSRVLIGEARDTANPKLNNCIKGWDRARHEWIVLADSNVLMPPDFLQRLQARLKEETGVVCSPPIGSRPASFWAEVECAYLNTFQCRWQYFFEALSIGFAHGKTMLWRRTVLDERGGLQALAGNNCEDSTTTKLMNADGLKVRLVDRPFEQPLGRRSFSELWSRQIRWAVLWRAAFPLIFAIDIFGRPILPAIAGVYAADRVGADSILVVALIAVAWYVPEILLTFWLRWHVSWSSPFAMLVRDFLAVAIWISSWVVNDFVWRGNPMSVRPTFNEPSRSMASNVAEDVD